MPVTLDGTTGIILSGAAGLSQTGDGELTLGNTLDVSSGGTGANNLNGIVKGDGTNALTAGKVSLSTEISGTLNVASGGTGVTAVGTTGNVLTSNGISWISQAPAVTAAPGTTGNVLTSNGTAWISQTLPPASNTINAPNFTGNIDANGSIRYALTALSANTVNCAQGNFFTRTASGAASWFTTNIPSGRAYTMVLELTNGGTGTQTWFANTRWAGGTAPTLTASGVDVLAFITDDAGVNWRGVALMTDSK